MTRLKRLRRLLLNAIVITWLILCIAPAAIWLIGRSSLNFSSDRHHLIGRWSYRLGNSRMLGSIGIMIYRDWPTPRVSPPMTPGNNYAPEVSRWFYTLPMGPHRHGYGFGFDNDTYFEVSASRNVVALGRYWIFGMPYWAAAAMWVPFPSFATRMWQRGLRSRRLKRGACAECGYDLRATPDRCPECGTIPKDVKGATTLSATSNSATG